MLLYVVLLAVVVACMVALGRCDRPVTPSAPAMSSGGDTIDVAIEYSPATYYTYADTLGGYDYDLLRLVSREAGRPMKFHPIVTLQKGLDALSSGDCDVLVAQFPVTAKNRERFLFTDPVYIDRQVLVQRAPAQVRSQLDLAGDTVYVVKGSPMVERLESLSREIGDTIHVVADDARNAEQLALMVAAGNIRLAVVNKSIASSLARRMTDIDISVDVSMSQFQAWALHKRNTALRDSLNVWLARVNRHPRVRDKLQARYFGN